MRYLCWVIFGWIFFGGIFCGQPLLEAYHPPASIDKKIWNMASPYFLPEEHPISSELDSLFKSQRANFSIASMKKAGFIHPYPRKWTRVIVTKHPSFPGYIFKIYLDTQQYHKDIPEHQLWIQRIQGIEEIARLIQENGWEDCFKTPKKWIYPLPAKPAPSKDFTRKYFILVEEDMEILDRKSNYALWKEIEQEKLEKLYLLLEASGLHDSKPDNIPFSIDGKLAFIDTQQIHAWPVLYKKISCHLAQELLPWWKNLIKNSKKKSLLQKAQKP